MPAPITLSQFAGSNLALEARQLPENVGVNAVDMEPGRDRFVPLKDRTTVATVPASPQRLTIWRMGRDAISDANYWLSSSLILNFVLGFGTDSTERTYYTGDTTPKWTNNVIGLTGGPPYPQASRELAVPAPTNPPTVALLTDGSGTQSTRYYVQTFVNDLGWESGPSPVSAGLVCRPGAIVDLTNLGAAPAGNYGFSTRRIYRTQPGTGGDADFYFLREVSVGTTTSQDDARALGSLMATYDGTVGSSWLPPPASGFGLIALWNGMMAMLAGKTLHLCEPGAPYAWPSKYDRLLNHTPVAAGKWGQNIVVLTNGPPIVYQGLDPLSLAPLPPGLNHPCRSARGVVSFPDGVAFPSNDGLAFIGDRGQVILTDGALTPEQWRALNPDTMIAGYWRGFYVCSYVDGAGPARKGFIVDPMNAGRVFWLSAGFDACHYDEVQQKLFVLEGGNVRSFATGAAMSATFTGKRFLQTIPVNYGYAKVIAAAYPVTLKVTARWVSLAGATQSSVETRSVANANAFALKSGFLAEDYQPEISGVNEVVVLRLATDMRDFKGL